MDVLLIELVLWGGLLFFFWALKDGLGRIETDLDAMEVLDGRQGSREAARRFAEPDTMFDQIGQYQDEPIYRYALVKGRRYQFDRVLPETQRGKLGETELCIRPGLVYVPDRDVLGAR
jgi:hypothetical protein